MQFADSWSAYAYELHVEISGNRLLRGSIHAWRGRVAGARRRFLPIGYCNDYPYCPDMPPTLALPVLTTDRAKAPLLSG